MLQEEWEIGIGGGWEKSGTAALACTNTRAQHCCFR
jgi:hypothetical protein